MELHSLTATGAQVAARPRFFMVEDAMEEVKRVRRPVFGVILPFRQGPAPEMAARRLGESFKVLELDDAARRRATWKRVLRYAAYFPSADDCTVA